MAAQQKSLLNIQENLTNVSKNIQENLTNVSKNIQNNLVNAVKESEKKIIQKLNELDTNDKDTNDSNLLDILAEVKKRGTLNAGIGDAADLFYKKQSDGTFTGIDADFIYALAVLIFGPEDYKNKVNFTLVDNATRFSKVRSRVVDITCKNSTNTHGRQTIENVNFSKTYLYDGMKFLGPPSDFSSDSELSSISGKTIGVVDNSTTAAILDAIAPIFNLTVKKYPTLPELFPAFFNQEFEIITSDATILAFLKSIPDFKDSLGTYVIFPKKPLSKEPLAAVYPKNDNKWSTIVNLLFETLILAEEEGISKDNIDTKLTEIQNPSVLRLFGKLDTAIQDSLGLDKMAFYNVVKTIGNYKDLYDKYFEKYLPRAGTSNDLHTNGGLMYSIPVGFEGLF